MLYLLIRLMLKTYSLSATVLLGLYIINDLYRPQKKIKPESNQNISVTKNNSFSFAKIIEFSNPILVYSLSKTMYGQLTELSILFLIFFSFNLVIASEIREILCTDKCTIFGWESIIVTDKVLNGNLGQICLDQVWEKRSALKGIVMANAVALAFENFLLIFESVKSEICLAIIQTLELGIFALFLEFSLFGNTNKIIRSLKRREWPDFLSRWKKRS